MQRLSSGLRFRFAEWIRGLPIPHPARHVKQLATLDKDAAFFNFNYTRTLSTLYGVNPERILFIHGCAALPDEELILGHAWHPQTRRSLNDRADIEEIDTRLMEANSILDSYFSKTFKPSEKLIQTHQDFFNSLTEIERVVVLGHSLSDVDAAYFNALLKQRSITASHWEIACRSVDDWGEKKMLLARLGIEPSKAVPVLWETL